MTQSPHREPEHKLAEMRKRDERIMAGWNKFFDSIAAMPTARAASLRPQPPTAFSRSGIAIAKESDNG